jgi:hypothetical protein
MPLSSLIWGRFDLVCGAATGRLGIVVECVDTPYCETLIIDGSRKPPPISKASLC